MVIGRSSVGGKQCSHPLLVERVEDQARDSGPVGGEVEGGGGGKNSPCRRRCVVEDWGEEEAEEEAEE